MGSRSEAVTWYKKFENKQGKCLKSLKKQDKTIYRIFKKTGSRREMKMIKNIKAKAYKKRCGDNINSSRDESYSDYFLSSNIQ